ncbi:class I SAM-dependent methyltransferase, partial [Metallibacterium scheffleri]|uniref:class I SAM-dependent methyltransferase n=1 Tax=Metallibacterium scheffleri TaxID=993689 RepID=UPI003CCFE04C
MAFTRDAYSQEAREKAIKRYRKFISRLKQNGHVLDAGCGTGRFVQYFIKDGFTVTGIDSSSSMIEFAAKNTPMVEFKVMDIRRLDFSSNYFDGIWNVATLLHLNESGVKCALQGPACSAWPAMRRCITSAAPAAACGKPPMAVPPGNRF